MLLHSIRTNRFLCWCQGLDSKYNNRLLIFNIFLSLVCFRIIGADLHPIDIYHLLARSIYHIIFSPVCRRAGISSLEVRHRCRRKKPLRWKSINTQIHTHTHTHTRTRYSSIFMLTHFIPLVSFDTLWKHAKTAAFLMFSWGVKEIVGMKWVKVRKSIWYACVKMLLNNSLFEVKNLSPSTALLVPTKTE